MKISYILDQLITCGGLIVPFEHCRELRAMGYDAVIMANGRNKELQDAYDVPVEDIKDDSDVVVSVWWPQVEQLDSFKGRKIQFIQGHDLKAYVGQDWKDKCLATRQKWELMAVSKYALDWTGRDGTIIPNGINNRFFTKHAVERDIDILIEGNDEPNKRINDAIRIAQEAGGKIGWLGRTTRDIEGITAFTNPPQEEIPKIYQRAKILLKFSDSEGFGLPYLEGMASGCLVICNDAGGNDFCEDGMNCLKPPMEKIPDMIKSILNNDNPKLAKWFALMIKKGEETAKQFTWEKAGEKLKKYYELNTQSKN